MRPQGFLPNHKLLAKALYRAHPKQANATRGMRTSTPRAAYEGRQPEEHAARSTSDSHHVQKDAVEEGKKDRAAGGSSDATSGKDQNDQNAKAKKDHPEAPGPVIGMNDERGGKGHTS